MTLAGSMSDAEAEPSRNSCLLHLFRRAWFALCEDFVMFCRAYNEVKEQARVTCALKSRACFHGSHADGRWLKRRVNERVINADFIGAAVG